MRQPAKGDGFGHEALRRAAGSAARALTGSKKAGFALPVEDAEAAAAVGEGALLGAYTYAPNRNGASNGKGKKNDAKSAPLGEVALLGGKPRDKEFQAAAARSETLAAEINRARDLINLPPNDLDPKTFAAEAQTAAKEFGLKVEVLDEKALKKGGYGGLMGVGQGSQSPPRLVRIAYTHPKADKTLALVGKGITYDSGGISLKPWPQRDHEVRHERCRRGVRRGRGRRPAGPGGQRHRLAGARREHAVRLRHPSR